MQRQRLPSSDASIMAAVSLGAPGSAARPSIASIAVTQPGVQKPHLPPPCDHQTREVSTAAGTREMSTAGGKGRT